MENPHRFPGATSVALGARSCALTYWVQEGLEGPRQVVVLGGPSSHPSSPLPANIKLQISIFMK